MNILSIIFLIIRIWFPIQPDTLDRKYPEIYNIQDLLVYTQDWYNAPELDLNLRQFVDRSTIKGTRNNFPGRQKDDSISILIDIIKENTEKSYWIYGDGFIQYWNGNLIINAPERIHKMIEDKVYIKS